MSLLVWKEKDEARQKLFFVLGLRLLVFVVLLAGLVAGTGIPHELVIPLIFYGLFSLGFLFPLGQKISPALSKSWIYFYAAQLILEVALEGVVLRYTGDFSSPYAVLFVLSIISASLIFRFLGTLLFTTLAALSYTIALGTAVAGGFYWPQLFFNFWSAFSSVDGSLPSYLLNLSVFYLTALAAGFLARGLSRKTEELNQAAWELWQTRLDLEGILQHMQSGVLTVDRTGKIVFLNRTAEEILGFSSKEVVGRDCRDVFRSMPELSEKLFSALYLMATEHRSELTVSGPGGRQIPLGISTAILGEKETGIRGVIAVFQDLTLAKTLEEKMKVRERLAAVGELSAGIAHEIRNPLASLCGSVEVLRKELELTEEQKTLFDLVQKETTRLNSIVTDFLYFARSAPPPLGRLDAVKVARETVELLKSNPAYQDYQIELKLFALNVWVKAEEGQLKQILLNLAVNGLEAMEKSLPEACSKLAQGPPQPDSRYGQGKKLSITCGYRARSGQEEALPFVAVSDEGKGIAPELRPKIFQPFFSTKKSGTGLGLPIVQRLVLHLEGVLELSSEAGHGTTFTLFLKRLDTKKESPLPWFGKLTTPS